MRQRGRDLYGLLRHGDLQRPVANLRAPDHRVQWLLRWLLRRQLMQPWNRE